MLDSLKISNAHRFANVKLTKSYSSTVKKMLANKSRYQTVSSKTGVPWPVIAAIHVREADMNFNTQLAQGDPLDRVSTHVPRGQGPYFGADAWERAALIALEDTGGPKWGDWTPGGWTTFLEKYNGLGYANKGRPSPYVWAGTNQYTSGKYIADGVYSSSAVDSQPGVVNLIYSLSLLDPTIDLNDLSKTNATVSTPVEQTETITLTKEQIPMLNSILTNWKTTLGGLGAIAAAISAFVTAGVYDYTHISMLFAAISAGFAMIFGKDANVTGGTVSQSPTSPKAV